MINLTVPHYTVDGRKITDLTFHPSNVTYPFKGFVDGIDTELSWTAEGFYSENEEADEWNFVTAGKTNQSESKPPEKEMTITNTGHPHHALFCQYLKEWAQDPTQRPKLEYKVTEDNWWPVSDSMVNWNPHLSYRLKPTMVTITYPAPLRKRPEYGDIYYTIDYDFDDAVSSVWESDEEDDDRFEAGICFKSYPDCRKFIDAVSNAK